MSPASFVQQDHFEIDPGLGAFLCLLVGTLFDCLHRPANIFYVLTYSVSSHGQVGPMRSKILSFVQFVSLQPRVAPAWKPLAQ